MLRDYTEGLTPELDEIFDQVGLADGDSEYRFLLQKFERVEPDVFIWMIRKKHTYILTITDGGSNVPSMQWLAKWCDILNPQDLECVTEGLSADPRGMQNGFDYVQIYRLPDDYDHQPSLY